MTVLEIEGYNKQDIEDFCGHVVSPRENSVYLCHKFFNLPDYTEISELFDRQGVMHDTTMVGKI